MSIPSEWLGSFPSVPQVFVRELWQNFSEQVEGWYIHDWEKVGTKAGKICEIAYSLTHGYATGTYETAPFKPKNFLVACTQLEGTFPTLSRSLRIQVPRVLIGVYELRNNRSVGHVGSPVQPNRLDGEYFFRSSKWIICEISRAICEDLASPGIDAFYDEVNISELPIIWEGDDATRVLRPGLSAAQKTIIILAHKNRWIDVSKLQSDVESKSNGYRQSILGRLHKDKLVEYDAGGRRAIILPAGIREARKLHAT